MPKAAISGIRSGSTHTWDQDNEVDLRAVDTDGCCSRLFVSECSDESITYDVWLIVTKQLPRIVQLALGLNPLKFPFPRALLNLSLSSTIRLRLGAKALRKSQDTQTIQGFVFAALTNLGFVYRVRNRNNRLLYRFEGLLKQSFDVHEDLSVALASNISGVSCSWKGSTASRGRFFLRARPV